MWRQTHTVARTVQKKWCLGQEGLYNVMPTLCTRIKRILYFQCLWDKRGLGNSWSRIVFVKSSMGWSTGSVQCVWSITIASRIFSGILRAYTFTLIPILAFIVTLLSSLRPKELFKGTLRQSTRASEYPFMLVWWPMPLPKIKARDINSSCFPCSHWRSSGLANEEGWWECVAVSRLWKDRQPKDRSEETHWSCSPQPLSSLWDVWHCFQVQTWKTTSPQNCPQCQRETIEQISLLE